MGFKVAACGGQEEAALAALKTARAAVTAWTADAWEAEMKIVLKSFRDGISHGGGKRFKPNAPAEDAAGSKPGRAAAAVGALSETRPEFSHLTLRSVRHWVLLRG